MEGGSRRTVERNGDVVSLLVVVEGAPHQMGQPLGRLLRALLVFREDAPGGLIRPADSRGIPSNVAGPGWR